MKFTKVRNWNSFLRHSVGGRDVQVSHLWYRRSFEVLTHWGRVTHICVSKLATIGSDNGLSPGRRQAIIWINDGKLVIGPLGTNFSEILIEIHTFSFKKMHLKMSSRKWRPFCFGLNVLKVHYEDKAVARPPHQHNENFFIGETTLLHWDFPLV